MSTPQNIDEHQKLIQLLKEGQQSAAGISGEDLRILLMDHLVKKQSRQEQDYSKG